MTGIIIGAVLFGIGALMIVMRGKKKSHLLEIKSIPTSTIQELKETSQLVKEELGQTGGFKQMAEVKGTIRCANPLTAELSKQPCVYYRMQVEERYEETYTEKDSEGKTVQKTRTDTTTVASNTQQVPFEIEDATGRITVNPSGANIEAIQVVNKYEPYTANETSLSFGEFRLNLTLGNTGGRNILGYQYTEYILPIDRQAFVIGLACDTSGELMIQNPGEKGKPFIVTTKSEEELIRGTESTVKTLMVVGIVCFVLGAVALGLGFAGIF